MLNRLISIGMSAHGYRDWSAIEIQVVSSVLYICVCWFLRSTCSHLPPNLPVLDNILPSQQPFAIPLTGDDSEGMKESPTTIPFPSSFS